MYCKSVTNMCALVCSTTTLNKLYILNMMLYLEVKERTTKIIMDVKQEIRTFFFYKKKKRKKKKKHTHSEIIDEMF